MAAFSRGLKSVTFVKSGDYICSRCLPFSTSSVIRSGHNRWSKIKHDKAGVDAKKNKARSVFSKEIATASKRKRGHSKLIAIFAIAYILTDSFQLVYGGDPVINTRLAALIASAKKGT